MLACYIFRLPSPADISCMRQGRLTLLLGPPGSGKSTLLKALSAKLDGSKSLRMAGKVTYNGHRPVPRSHAPLFNCLLLLTTCTPNT